MELSPQHQLWLCVPGANARHSFRPLLWRQEIRHRLVAGLARAQLEKWQAAHDLALDVE